MLVDPGPLVYRGSPTATHTARAVAGSNGYTRVVSVVSPLYGLMPILRAWQCTGAAWQRR